MSRMYGKVGTSSSQWTTVTKFEEKHDGEWAKWYSKGRHDGLENEKKSLRFVGFDDVGDTGTADRTVATALQETLSAIVAHTHMTAGVKNRVDRSIHTDLETTENVSTIFPENTHSALIALDRIVIIVALWLLVRLWKWRRTECRWRHHWGRHGSAWNLHSLRGWHNSLKNNFRLEKN